MPLRDLIIVGAGPAGLAAAIAAKQLDLDYVVVEKGVLVNSIHRFPTQMVFFTTPELLEIGSLPFLTPYEKPTRPEALKYYRRVADAYQIQIVFGEEVLAIECEQAVAGLGRVFAVHTESPRGIRGCRRARAVIVATGYYDHPNVLGVPGEDLPHVSHYYTEAHGCYRQKVVVVGGKNSAAEASLELYRAGAEVTLVHRGETLGDSIKYWVRPDIDNRIAEGAVAARFNARVVRILPTMVVIERGGAQEEIAADAVWLLTGYHANLELLARAGVRIDRERCAPFYDPETLETNVPGLFLAGGVVSGKDTSPIFIENGRFHGERAVRTIGRMKNGE